MPAKSKSQQKLFALVYKYKNGELNKADIDSNELWTKIVNIAKGISKQDAKDFASTKHKSLPDKIKKEQNKTMKKSELRQLIREEIKKLNEASYRYWIEVSKKDAAILWDIADSIPSIDYIIEPGRKSNVITFYDSFHGDKVAAELKKRKIKYDDNL